MMSGMNHIKFEVEYRPMFERGRVKFGFEAAPK